MLGIIGIGRHSRTRDLLSAYVDGEATPGEAARVEGHLSTCDECQRDVRDLRTTVDLLRGLPELTAPRSFRLAAPPVVVRPSPTYTLAAGLATSVAALFLVALVLGDVFDVVRQSAGVEVRAVVESVSAVSSEGVPLATELASDTDEIRKELAGPERTPEPRAALPPLTVMMSEARIAAKAEAEFAPAGPDAAAARVAAAPMVAARTAPVVAPVAAEEEAQPQALVAASESAPAAVAAAPLAAPAAAEEEAESQALSAASEAAPAAAAAAPLAAPAAAAAPMPRVALSPTPPPVAPAALAAAPPEAPTASAEIAAAPPAVAASAAGAVPVAPVATPAPAAPAVAAAPAALAAEAPVALADVPSPAPAAAPDPAAPDADATPTIGERQFEALERIVAERGTEQPEGLQAGGNRLGVETEFLQVPMALIEAEDAAAVERDTPATAPEPDGIGLPLIQVEIALGVVLAAMLGVTAWLLRRRLWSP